MESVAGEQKLRLRRFGIRRYHHDWFVVVGILAVLVGIYGYTIYAQRARIYEQTLIFELQSLRNAVAAFNLVEGRNPQSLEELGTAVFITEKGGKRSYVPKKLKENGFKDPFGNVYSYGVTKGGWVKSTTEGYGYW